MGESPWRGGPVFGLLSLLPLAKVPELHVVRGKELAGKAEAAIFFFLRGTRHPAGAEETVGLELPKAVLPVARADTAVLHADLPVLLGIFNSNRCVFHEEVICAARDKRFPNPGKTRAAPKEPVDHGT